MSWEVNCKAKYLFFSKAITTYSILESDFLKKIGKQATYTWEGAFFTVKKDPEFSVMINATIFGFFQELWGKQVAAVLLLVFTGKI